MNARKFPEWGSDLYLKVKDYQGNTCMVAEPNALAIYPMSKTINDTHSADNAINLRYAINNNPNVNIASKLIYSGGMIELEGGLFDA